GSKERLSQEELEVWNECKSMCTICKISIEVHLGLSMPEEKQMFYDLNSYAKAIETSLANKMDTSNPINTYTMEILQPKIFKSKIDVSGSNSDADWNTEAPTLTGKSLSAIHAILFLNKGNIKGATPSDITEYKKEIANNFWNVVLEIPGFLENKPKLHTVVAQPVVLKAIAKLFFEMFFGKNKNLNNETNQNKLMEGLKSFDFSHDNEVWKYYQMLNEERTNKFPGLTEYLPIDEEDSKNRDMGGFDLASNTFRFGAKHNDIVPLISDIIKWKIQLPSRQKKVAQMDLILQ
ncbi:MAG: DNA sulfur modification protein DndB, partial [Ferruginibacter sp.]